MATWRLTSHTISKTRFRALQLISGHLAPNPPGTPGEKPTWHPPGAHATWTSRATRPPGPPGGQPTWREISLPGEHTTWRPHLADGPPGPPGNLAVDTKRKPAQADLAASCLLLPLLLLLLLLLILLLLLCPLLLTPRLLRVLIVLDGVRVLTASPILDNQLRTQGKGKHSQATRVSLVASFCFNHLPHQDRAGQISPH